LPNVFQDAYSGGKKKEKQSVSNFFLRVAIAVPDLTRNPKARQQDNKAWRATAAGSCRATQTSWSSDALREL
jgi:hypothetical protein